MTPSILIVEDESATRQMMSSMLCVCLEKARVDQAGDVATATGLIERAGHDAPYDIVVLDFMLPQSAQATNPQVDESLCRLASRDSFVIHITSYGDDAAVLGHIQRYHSGRSATPFVLIRKEPGWADEVIDTVRRYIAGRKVSRALADVFLNFDEYSAPLPASIQSPTYALGYAVRTIMQYWPDLDAVHRDQVQVYFFVNEDENQIKEIRLLGFPPE